MIFVDSWAWLALAYRRDPWHAVAMRQHQMLQQRKVRYVTSDYVLSETITLLFGVLNFAQASRFMEAVFQGADAGRHDLVFISPDQFRRAWELRQRYHDKPDISFVDFTSMVVMQDLGITDVFTGDGRFRQVGLGFRLLP